MPINVQHSPDVGLLGSAAAIAGSNQYGKELAEFLRQLQSQQQQLQLQSLGQAQNFAINQGRLGLDAARQRQQAQQFQIGRQDQARGQQFQRQAGLDNAFFSNALRQQRDQRLQAVQQQVAEDEFRRRQQQAEFTHELGLQRMDHQDDLGGISYLEQMKQKLEQDGHVYTDADQMQQRKLEGEKAAIEAAFRDNQMSEREHRKQQMRIRREIAEIRPTQPPPQTYRERFQSEYGFDPYMPDGRIILPNGRGGHTQFQPPKPTPEQQHGGYAGVEYQKEHAAFIKAQREREKSIDEFITKRREAFYSQADPSTGVLAGPDGQPMQITPELEQAWRAQAESIYQPPKPPDPSSYSQDQAFLGPDPQQPMAAQDESMLYGPQPAQPGPVAAPRPDASGLSQPQMPQQPVPPTPGPPQQPPVQAVKSLDQIEDSTDDPLVWKAVEGIRRLIAQHGDEPSKWPEPAKQEYIGYATTIRKRLKG